MISLVVKGEALRFQAAWTGRGSVARWRGRRQASGPPSHPREEIVTKRMIVAVAPIFSAAALAPGQSISADAVGMAVGVFVGVKGIPGPLLVLASSRRRRAGGRTLARDQPLPTAPCPINRPSSCWQASRRRHRPRSRSARRWRMPRRAGCSNPASGNSRWSANRNGGSSNGRTQADGHALTGSRLCERQNSYSTLRRHPA